MAVARPLRSFVGQRYEMVSLPYVWQGSLNPGIDGVANKQFRLGSFYDPEYAGGGSTPPGFSQLAALYDRYVVYSVEYQLVVHSTTTGSPATGGGKIAVGASNDAGATLATTPEDAILRADKWTAWTHSDGGPAIAKLSGRYYIPSIVGHKYKMHDTNHSALTSGNPSNTVLMNIQSMGVDTTSDPAAHWVTIKLIYKGIFFEPKRLNMT